MPDDDPTAAPSAVKPRLHGELLSTSLLAFLKNWNAYGYQLTQRLAESGMPECDSGTVYRQLRQLEKDGFVSSFWDTSANGPARRMYTLTKAGELFLTGWVDVLQNYQRVLLNAFTNPFAPTTGDSDDNGPVPSPNATAAGDDS